MVKSGVLFEVRTGFLYTVQTRSGFEGLKNNYLPHPTRQPMYRLAAWFAYLKMERYSFSHEIPCHETQT
jgi:hypothetical protein